MEAVDGGTLERRGVGGLDGVDRTLLPLYLLGHDRLSSMVYYYLLPGEEFYFDIIIISVLKRRMAWREPEVGRSRRFNVAKKKGGGGGGGPPLSMQKSLSAAVRAY